MTITPTCLPMRDKLRATWAECCARARNRLYAAWLRAGIASAEKDIAGFERDMQLAQWEIEWARERLEHLPQQIAYHEAWLARQRRRLAEVAK